MMKPGPVISIMPCRFSRSSAGRFASFSANTDATARRMLVGETRTKGSRNSGKRKIV